MTPHELTMDATVRHVDEGRALLGGSPVRLLKLSTQAQSVLRDGDWGSRSGRALATRLISAGFAHPIPQPGTGPKPCEVSVVIPVLDRPDAVRRLVNGLDQALEVIVIDDGSRPAQPGAAARHPKPRGPAAARNTGIARATRPFIALVDSDVVAPAGWLERLLPHFADPHVGAVAGRIVTARGGATTRIGRLLARYDAARSPLDLGSAPARVAPGSRVSYVPAAALVVRRAALGEGSPAFDESLRYGEDVDLGWRLMDAGWTVRYEPASAVGHAPRLTLRSAAAQRFGYGLSAAPLAARHPGRLAPVAGNRWTTASWLLLAAGHPRAAGGAFAGTAARLARSLPVRRPLPLAIRLAARSFVAAGGGTAEALTRPYGPLALPLLLVGGWQRAARRRIVVAALLLPAAAEFVRKRPDVNPLGWLALRSADDLCYGAGVWVGCLRERSFQALRPRA